MKNLVVVIVFLMISTISFAQGVFDKFEDREGVTSVVVNKKMFEMMSKVKVDAKDKEMQQYMNLLKKLDNLKVFTTSNTKIGADMKASVNSYLKSNPLEELIRTSGDGKNVKIFVKSVANETTIRELLMFIEGSNVKDAGTVVLSLIGNFSLEEISMLTEKMNLPGGYDLKKASKK
jgi:alpha-acetolactate decarboxylase